MRRFSYLLLAGALLLCAADTQAQVLTVHLHDGRVTLHAQDVPLRLILQEWAKAADATIVNVDQIPGGLVTLHLVDVNERAALETVLRNTVGYILAERSSANGASTFDRILIMAPTGSAPNGQSGQTFSGRASPTPLAPPPASLPSVVAIGKTPDEVGTSSTEVSGESMAAMEDPPGIVSERSPERANRMVGSTFGAASRAASPRPGASVPQMFGVTASSAQPGVISPAPAPPGPSASPSEMLEEPR